MAARLFLAGETPTIRSCVAHRCEDHEDLPPVNSDGPDLSECGICVGQRFVEAFELKFWNEIFWPSIESARSKLRVLGGADLAEAFVQEAHARIRGAQMDPDVTKH
jgi:hypothetical protein